MKIHEKTKIQSILSQQGSIYLRIQKFPLWFLKRKHSHISQITQGHKVVETTYLSRILGDF